jgi:hypothetical protein
MKNNIMITDVIYNLLKMLEVLDFLMGHESYLRNDEFRSQVSATNRPENIVIRYVSFVS